MNHDPVNVLIVEDEHDIAAGISRSLGKLEGISQVKHLPSAERAKEELMKRRYSIVVSDIRLGGMDGLELLSFIKANYPGTRVVMMTAFPCDHVELEAKKLRTDSYLEKPFDLKVLKDLVRRFVYDINEYDSLFYRPDHRTKNTAQAAKDNATVPDSQKLTRAVV